MSPEYTADYIKELWAGPTHGRHLRLLNAFVNASKAYIISRETGSGFAFWLVTPEISAKLALVDGRMLPGRNIAALLDSMVASGGNIPLSMTEARMPQETLDIPTWRVGDIPGPEAADCYRTYMSAADLDKIFSFPAQKEYEPFADVIIVTSTTSLRQGVVLHRITEPVEMVYTVVCPDGVTANPQVVRRGGRMTLIFSKQGFTSQSLSMTAGSASPFVRYMGAAILVNTLQSVGLNFSCRIPVTVRSANGRPISGYEITVNGRSVDTSRPFIDLTERDLAPGNVVEIIAISTNYEALVMRLPAEKADCNRPLDIVLQPRRQGVKLRLNFADSTVVEHEMLFEPADERYRMLRAGSYCGFRTHLVSLPGAPEVYNVDVRAGGKPVAVAMPAPAVARTPSGEKDVADAAAAPAAPPAVPAANPIARPVNDDEENSADTIPAGGMRRKRRRRSYTPTWVICVAIVVAVGIAAAAVLYLPGLYRTYFASEEGPAVVEVKDTIAEELNAHTPENVPGVAEISSLQAREEGIEERREKAKAEAAAAALAGNADMEYLQKNRVWKRASLTTDDGRQAYDILSTGDIDAILAFPYYNSGNAAINPTASKIADLLYGAKGTPTQRSNEVALMKLKDQESIDLWTLYESLARLRPAEPNPGARP